MSSMQAYLDANILFGFFKNLIESSRHGRKNELPDVIKFFRKHENIKIYASVLTKGEIFRILKENYELSATDLDRMWNSLEKLLKIRMIEQVDIDNQLVDLVRRHRFRSKINNVIHLWVCSKLSLTFISGDNDICEDGKRVYPEVMSYPDLRKIIKS
jgi:hypothetical protein